MDLGPPYLGRLDLKYDWGRGDWGMLVALILILVVVGTVAFHFLSPWWWTEIASNWGYIDNTIIITFWITGVVFIAIIGFTAYCVYRFHHIEGRKAFYEPENTKLEWWLTGLTTVGIAALLAPGLFVWGQFISVPAGAAEFEVLAQQWMFTYRYPGKDGKLGTTDIKKITPENPFGINKDDPNGQDDILIESDDAHLPIDKPVKVLLRSVDVLHNFYTPQFRAKMDIVPGMITYFWFTPTRTGTFDVLCFELCGTGHYAMRSNVVVEDESAYNAWLAQQPTFAQLMKESGRGLAKQPDPQLPILDGRKVAEAGRGAAPVRAPLR